MIIDTIKNLHLYADCIPEYNLICDFLSNNDLQTLKPGKHEINGQKLYVSVNEYNTQLNAPVRLEAHKVYIDLQLIVTGSEFIRTSITNDLKLSEPYQNDCDAAFYTGNKPMGNIHLKAGHFAVFFPHDAHQPCLSDNDRPEPVKKLVFKIQA